ncbi:MAG TPA: glucose-6-phosphate dehydrogenase assembly protein OpcA [Candidatus Limnocylindrales bacterium]|nr:glucose-6-phosphate dehydrogenase assembly protein OpcA [Candidatus Limnocylindrales bacterium]
MAKAIAPIDLEERGTWRWYLHTDSIRGTTDALSRLWVRVAQEAGSGALLAGDTSRALARGDPRLAAGMRPDDEGMRVRTRTSVLTLVVVAPRPEVVKRAMSAVATLASRHPSRTIVLSPTDPDGPAAFDAHVYASCQLPERSSSEICTEEILIKLGGELAQHLSSTVAPLLIHDLPVVLWWPDDVPFGRPDFTELSTECDRLFVDSGHFRGNGLARLRGLADAVYGGIVVHDVSWMRLMLWRELLASCFDHPLLVRELKHLQAIRVDVARPGAEVRLSRAALFVGWLMSRLRLGVVEPLRQGPDDTWIAKLRSRRRDIAVRIRPVEVEVSGVARSAGSMVRAELEASCPEAHTVVNVTRQADHLLATADWNGASVSRRASQLERFEEVPYLAESLDRTSHERIFGQALEKAVTLIGDASRG